MKKETRIAARILLLALISLTVACSRQRPATSVPAAPRPTQPSAPPERPSPPPAAHTAPISITILEYRQSHRRLEVELRNNTDVPLSVPILGLHAIVDYLRLADGDREWRFVVIPSDIHICYTGDIIMARLDLPPGTAVSHSIGIHPNRYLRSTQGALTTPPDHLLAFGAGDIYDYKTAPPTLFHFQVVATKVTIRP